MISIVDIIRADMRNGLGVSSFPLDIFIVIYINLKVLERDLERFRVRAPPNHSY